ncbi:MAG: heavy metal-associated domain-containing protein [Candidatus Micrarchaeota archaeon]
MEQKLKVNGMHCKSCEMLLTDVLSEIDGVSNVEVSEKNGSVKFTCANESVETEVRKAIANEGYVVL